ncbi:MAG: glycosyltransferase family 4 protein [Gemmatimonadetes bacterium]|nr:glycosyltransferase family 4 protein [Gemmatimonadota bacterium]
MPGQGALTVLPIPFGGDYLRSLYGAMPEGAIRECRLGPWLDPSAVDILHLHVPERLGLRPGLDPGTLQRRYLAFIEDVGRSPIRVVWTVHNRRPHRGDPEWGGRLYRAWARVADAVIHQSRWGREVALGELPFPGGIRHEVIPHGHFGDLMPQLRSRAELERELGLPPCAMRFGALGQPLETKRVDLILRAFQRAGRPDQQLLVTAVTRDQAVPADPRIFVLSHEGWRARAEVAAHLHVCDALVCAHGGSAYLSSGQVGDAIGAGLPMLASPLGFFREAMGEACWSYDGTEAGLAALFVSLTAEEVARGKRASRKLRSACSWAHVARATLDVYRRVLA